MVEESLIPILALPLAHCENWDGSTDFSEHQFLLHNEENDQSGHEDEMNEDEMKYPSYNSFLGFP